MTTQELRNKLEQKKGQRMQIESNIIAFEKEISDLQADLFHHEQAREVIREVGMRTQQQLQSHISEITSLAMENVFDDPYELKVEFVKRRNKSECDLYFMRNGNRLDPLDASGLGAVDVAAFSLRIACWMMQNPHTRNVLILDEPFKHLKGEYENIRVLDMIQEISKKLNIQIIMISDERIDRTIIEEKADKVFVVSITNGVSKCE